MHEQAGGFAAEGYAKIKGDLGVALATSGPGGQNFVTPIGNCFYDSVPCLFITGQINSRFLRPDESIRQIGFQETDIVSKETYDFIDRGKRSNTLRPEGTAGVVRSYIENKLYADKIPVKKLYYMGPMFRYERPQKGRYRQFAQFGVEAFGSDSPMLDAEVITYAVSVLKGLKIKDVTVHINSIGDEESKAQYKDALVAYLNDKMDTLCHDCNNRFKTNPLRILDCKIDGGSQRHKLA